MPEANSELQLPPEDLRAIQKTTALTEPQVMRLYRRFTKLDRHHSGSIGKDELFSIPALASNPLAERMLDAMRSSPNEGVTFVRFAQAMSVLSAQASKEEKLRFTFKMYDVDGDGRISNRDLYIILCTMVGANLTTAQVQQIVDKTFIEADTDRDGYITYEDFEGLAGSSDYADRLNLQI